MDLSYKTAIKRSIISKPLQYLLKTNKITKKSKILDYGCGRGDDVKFLSATGFNVIGYDPYYNPIKLNGKFNIVICNYVLNVVDAKVRQNIINKMSDLAPKGIVYIAVRRDVLEYQKSKIGTQQYYVRLPYKTIKENSSFCLYEIKNRV